jgi:uridine kinase
MMDGMSADETRPDPAMCTLVRGPAAVLVARLHELLVASHVSLFVGIDGRSGAGKSTLAATVARDLAESGTEDIDVTVIEGDGFYAGGSAGSWDRRTAEEKADRVIDWRRQRGVLEQLRDRRFAEWHPFDWHAKDWDGEPVPLAAEPVVAPAARVVLLEGAYSCRPELHDLLDLRVLLDVSHQIRRRQLLEREGDAYRAEWEARWSMAEDHYFRSVMPPEHFDLVLSVS